MQHEHISAVIERAKQQRAEYIGKSIGKHPIITLIVIAIPVLLTQVQWRPSAPIAEAADTRTTVATTRLL